jgi:hypothetical protein
MIKTLIIALLFFILTPTDNINAQNRNTDLPPTLHDSGLTAIQTEIIIDSIGNKLRTNYIFPEIAEKMLSKLENNLSKGFYKSIDDPMEFANKLTQDLQSVSNDIHLRVIYAPEMIAEEQKVVTAADSLKFINKQIDRMKRENFGFKEVKILDGNIGYLNLKGFFKAQYAGETAVAAMNFLSNTDALIIDLRQNGGGTPGIIQLITSYLYGAENMVHLNTIYWKPTDTYTHTYTLPHVSGKRNPFADIYILTSSRTFSAAEEFSYNLKQLKRATLIGETTGGGAHAGGMEFLTDRFAMWIPAGNAINPISNTNWEGTGVVPHIKVKAEQALEIAQITALDSLSKKTQDLQMKHYYEWHLKTQKALLNPIKIEPAILKSYTGRYNERVVTFENGKLYYQRGDRGKYELTPLSEDEFKLKGLPDFRIRFILENNTVIALEGYYDDGRTDRDLKSPKK